MGQEERPIKRLGSSLCALVAGCVVACSQTTQISPLRYLPNAGSVRDRWADTTNYRVLHSFGAGHDGSNPNQVISVGDKFYGTTQGGGASYCGCNYDGCGTVFSISPGILALG